MSDDLAEALGPVGFGMAAGAGSWALLRASGGGDWLPLAIVALISLLVGLLCLAWSLR